MTNCSIDRTTYVFLVFTDITPHWPISPQRSNQTNREWIPTSQYISLHLPNSNRRYAMIPSNRIITFIFAIFKRIRPTTATRSSNRRSAGSHFWDFLFFLYFTVSQHGERRQIIWTDTTRRA